MSYEIKKKTRITHEVLGESFIELSLKYIDFRVETNVYKRELRIGYSRKFTKATEVSGVWNESEFRETANFRTYVETESVANNSTIVGATGNIIGYLDGNDWISGSDRIVVYNKTGESIGFYKPSESNYYKLISIDMDLGAQYEIVSAYGEYDFYWNAIMYGGVTVPNAIDGFFTRLINNSLV